MQVYVVLYADGDYEDAGRRLVAAYTDEQAADRHAGLANAWLRETAQQFAAASNALHAVPRSPFDPAVPVKLLLPGRGSSDHYEVAACPLLDAAHLALAEGLGDDNTARAAFADHLDDLGYEARATAAWRKNWLPPDARAAYTRELATALDEYTREYRLDGPAARQSTIQARYDAALAVAAEKHGVTPASSED